MSFYLSLFRTYGVITMFERMVLTISGVGGGLSGGVSGVGVRVYSSEGFNYGETVFGSFMYNKKYNNYNNRFCSTSSGGYLVSGVGC